ncbi:hypothetical protein HNQ80_000538 [Anaerosolibacter carboniphilus]|uniref:Uncharacterized protein n=1 Tax=Anaerosolibacter carboniphilus TaxID=1417629 RepID=A0A841KQR0_9FIRM|nr:hypothetical protein [Anaerosolibacter carboniphilus]MBB6214458.1 hypothetical protein [Anaerosolibacter carboniphilus]
MKKRYIIALTICIFLMVPQVAKACWAYLTVDELVEQSDVILIGEIVERLEGSIKKEDMHYAKWRVKAYYYIKGEMNDSEMIVGTPNGGTSIDYDLNANGNQVLLFLKKDGIHYFPHSPQAMVGITFDKEKIQGEKKISGEELVKLIDINGQNMNPEDRGKLETYLSTREAIQGIDWTAANSGVQKNITMMGGFALIGASGIIFLIARKK